ncbi:hypothetical protein SEA_HOTOROBO_62 [Gordonia phage Hotorobo]|uniref:Uncharacterized protein n=1 Tax=Gordonia phage Hotorobo TaxID=1821554 RepID=A0A142K8C1_9CAUD|nr:hypothetical protein BJD64_gp071 [Gordonia phage Hotorobo]AMS02354.1 hypothetical protein SEA_HOTOROBO_62 [Gordonia phage Hotorobo]
MTSLQPSQTTGTDVVSWDGMETGLEDFDTNDLTMPRLSIDHPEAAFKNSQTDELFNELTVILLGLHKSRIMWGEMSDGDDQDPPLCKSPDMRNGFPNMDTELPTSKQFPWEAQDVYGPDDASPLFVGPEQNLLTMPSIGCKDCHFKEWNTDPSGKKPWCSEEWTFPLLYQDPEDPEVWVPALFTIRRSGIKPARQYVTPFASKKTPIFTVATKLTLDVNKRGMVKFCTPIFTKVAKTNPESYQDYFDSFKSAQGFLLQYPMPRDDEDKEAAAAKAAATVPDGDIEGNVIDADVVPEEPTPTPQPEPTPTPTPQPAQPAPPQAQTRVQPEPTPEPTPPSPPAEEQVISTKGKVKPLSNTAPAAGTVQIDEDEEPPF